MQISKCRVQNESGHSDLCNLQSAICIPSSRAFAWSHNSHSVPSHHSPPVPAVDAARAKTHHALHQTHLADCGEPREKQSISKG
jgi:hypothetical protein